MLAIRSRSVAGVLVAAVLLLSGCDSWLQPGEGPEHRRFNGQEDSLTAANVATLDELWSLDLPGAATEPLVLDGRIFVRVDDPAATTLQAFDAATGGLLWTHGTPEVPMDVPPTIWRGRVWSGQSHHLYDVTPPVCLGTALSFFPETGVGNHGREVGSPSTSFPLAIDDGFAVMSVAPLSSDCVAGTPHLELRDVAPDDSSSLSRVVWSDPVVATETPAIADGQLFVPAGDTLYAFPLDCTTPCSPLWTASFAGSIGSPMVGFRGQVFVRTDNGLGMVALDAETGAEMWRVAPGPVGVTEIAVTLDTLYVGRSTELQAYDADGCGAAVCAPLWRGPLTGAGRWTMAVAGGVVYAGTSAGVDAFAAGGCGTPTCAPLLQLETPSLVEHISVAEGRLWVVDGGDIGEGYRLSAYAPTP